MKSAASRLASRTWVMLFLAFAWCAAVLALWLLRPVPAPHERAEAAALRTELVSLPADAVARSRAVQESQPRGAANAVHHLLDSLGNEGWRVTGTGDGPVLVPADGATAHWAGILRTVERLEATAGLAVASLRIETAGSRTVRQFSRIEIGLRIDGGPSPANPVRPPPEPGVGPRSGPGAAGLRETGPATLSALRPPPPAATEEAGSVFRTGGAPVPATLAPAAGSAQRNPNPDRTW